MEVSIWNGTYSKTILEPDLMNQLEGLYAFYHRLWWCHGEMFYHFKWCHGLLNASALLIMAAGVIVGSVLENSILVACLTAIGTVVKGWNDFKKFSFKVDLCRFTYTIYEGQHDHRICTIHVRQMRTRVRSTLPPRR